MVLLHATEDDVNAWAGESLDANLTPLIRSASILVTAACRNDLYDLDASGKPADEDLADAMRDATCAQVVYWAKSGITPSGGAASITPAVTEVSVDGATEKADATVVAASAAEAVSSLSTLTSEAYQILRSAGLASSAVW
ncbi:hypothetical protein [Gordonia sp. NPDC003376]